MAVEHSHKGVKTLILFFIERTLFVCSIMLHRIACELLVAGLFLACGLTDQTPTQSPTLTPPGPQLLANRLAYYPRTLHLQHQPAGKDRLLTSFDTDKNRAALFESLDDGQTWQPVAEVVDTTAKWHCCSGLWEMPQPLGRFATGTLFWSPSMGCPRDPRCQAAITIHRSADGGRTWQPHSTLVTGNVGLWEPEFIVDAKGQLVAYYSTEEHRGDGFNQLLAHKVSTDGGLTWGSEIRDVALPDQPDKKMRPGMAIVRQLPNKSFAMVYEICGMGCDVYIRFSKDGLAWGSPTDPGTRLESAKGQHFAHAPSFTVAPDGSLLVVGQLVVDGAGKVTSDNGRVILVNRTGGTGLWTQQPAPVPVPEAYDNPCPNYSSQLLVLPTNKTLLEVALKPDDGMCKPYVATSALPDDFFTR